VDLDEIFAGVGVGSLEDDGARDGATNLDGAGAAQPDDRPQPGAGRRRQGDDGLGARVRRDS